jgi:hypothetical protein
VQCKENISKVFKIIVTNILSLKRMLSFQHIASLGIPLTVLYTMKERYDFRWILWKKRLYAYIPGERGIEGNLKALGFLPHSKPMLQMARPIFDK